MEIKRTKIPIYGGTWIIIFTDELKKVEEKYKIDPVDGFDALFMSRGSKYQYVTAFETNRATPGIIAHECVHLLNKIFVHNGVDLDLENDEHQAYLMAWLVNRVHEFKDKIKS